MITTQIVPGPQPIVIPQILLPDVESSLMKIPSLLKVGADEVEHVILYGETGTGKTALAGLLSEFFNVLWLDGDKGMTTLVNMLPQELQDRIHPIKIPDNTDYPLMCSTILRLVTGRKYKVCMIHGTTDCIICNQNKEAIQVEVELNKLPKNWVVVMDSQTQFYASVLAFAYYKDTGKAPGTGVVFDYKGDWDFRGIAYQMCDMFGNFMKDLRCQWVSISHEMFTEIDDEVTKKVVPIGGSKNISSNYGKWFGSQVYAKRANNKHNFFSSSLYSATAQTKSRSNVVLEVKSTPSLLHIFRPNEAEQLLKSSYSEWWLSEGYKDIKARSKGQENPPTPKGILST
jgi:hypothetical protein